MSEQPEKEIKIGINTASSTLERVNCLIKGCDKSIMESESNKYPYICPDHSVFLKRLFQKSFPPQWESASTEKDGEWKV